MAGHFQFLGFLEGKIAVLRGKMAQIGFLVITFDSEVQMTSGFHWCASFKEIFHMTTIMTMILHICGGAKWPQIALLDHFGPFSPTTNV